MSKKNSSEIYNAASLYHDTTFFYKIYINKKRLLPHPAVNHHTYEPL